MTNPYKKINMFMRMIDSTPELQWRLFRITGPLLIRIVPT